MKKNGLCDVEINGITKPENMPLHPVWFTTFTTCYTLTMPSEKSPIAELISLTMEAEIISSTLHKTPEAISFEGKMLEGYILLPALLLKHNIKYLSTDQSLCMTYLKQCTDNITITLPSHYVHHNVETYYEMSELHRESKLLIRPYIEDVYCRMNDSNTLQLSVAILINVGIKKLRF